MTMRLTLGELPLMESSCGLTKHAPRLVPSIRFNLLTSTFWGSSFSGSGFLISGSGAFSSVSSIWLMLPVAGLDLVPPRDKDDLGRVLQTKQ